VKTILKTFGRHGVLTVFLILAVVSSASVAQADPVPGTFTLDRMDSNSRVGFQVGFDKFDRVSLSDRFLMRFNPYGQFVFPGKTVGLYGQLPIAHMFDFNGLDVTGIGNLDFGVFFLPTHHADLILRVGLIVGTASSSGDRKFANLMSGLERMTDLLMYVPDTTTFRVSASTLQQSGRFFFRGDLGFDLTIDKPSGDNRIYFRANAAVGVRLGGVDLSAELVNLGMLDHDYGGELSDRFVHTLAFGLRTRGANQFHLGTVFPLDDNTSGDIWIFSLGYQHVFN
jgi:hypothetical protein